MGGGGYKPPPLPEVAEDEDEKVDEEFLKKTRADQRAYRQRKNLRIERTVNTGSSGSGLKI